MSGDLVIFVSALVGLTFKRLATPPRWALRVQDAVEILVGSAIMVLAYAVMPATLIPKELVASDLRMALMTAVIGFFVGPGIVTIAKALFYERLPSTIRGMLPPAPPPPPAGNAGGPA